MSFAPTKNSTRRKKSPGGSPHKPERAFHGSRLGIESPSTMSLPRNSKNITGNPELDLPQKLEILESNLTRVSQQQEALLPLMNMIDLAPSVQKNEGILKSLHKKQSETESQQSKLENMFRNYQTNVDSTLTKLSTRPVSNFDAGLFEKNLKSIGNQVTDQQAQFRELEDKFTKLEQGVGDKLHEELGMLYQKVENKLEKHRSETIAALKELKTGTNSNLKRFDEVLKDIMTKSEKFADFMKQNDRKKILEDIDQLVTLKNREQLEYFKDKYNRDIDNLYSEFGIIRSEMDLINEEKRQQKITALLATLPKDVTLAEKKIKINNIEQTLNINELEKFNKENTQRIMYELQAFDEKLDSLKEVISNIKSKHKSLHDPKLGNLPEMINLREDMEVINERYLNIKYQIEGAKKKYLFDMRKIEDKMEKLEQIKKESIEELEVNPKSKRIIPQELKVIEEFPEKLKELMGSINKNLETTFARLDLIEEKIKDNQEGLRK